MPQEAEELVTAVRKPERGNNQKWTEAAGEHKAKACGESTER